MKKLIAALVLASFTSSSVSRAEEANTVPELDPGEVVAPIKSAHAAPFSGVLMSPRATARIISELSGINDKVALEVFKATSELNAKHKFEMSEADSKCKKETKMLQDEIDIRKSDMKNDAAEIDRLNAELKKKEAETPSRAFWAGVGFAGGIAVTVLTVFAINKASN